MARSWGGAEIERVLSGRPEQLWPWGLVHHAARVLLLVLVAFSVHLLFPLSPAPDLPELDQGMVVARDVIARVSFPIYKSRDELSRERADAAASVPPVLVFEPAAADTLVARATGFFASVDSALARNPGAAARGQALTAVLAARGLPATSQVVRPLLDASVRAYVLRALIDVAREDLPAGVISLAELQRSTSPQLRLVRDGHEQLVARDAVHPPAWLYDRAALRLPWNAAEGAAELQRLLLIRFFPPSLRLDDRATVAAQLRAREAVSPVAGQVLRGETVVGAHQQVGDEELQRLHSYRNELTRIGRLEGGMAARLRSLGAFLFDLLTLLVFGLLLRVYRPAVYQQFRHVTVLTLLVLGLAGVAAIIAHFNAPIELIPVAVPVLVVAALWDGPLALHLALVQAVLLAGQTPFLGVTTLLTLVLGGAAAALSVRMVRRRAQTWVFMALIAGAYAAAALTLGLLRGRPLDEVLLTVLWGVMNAAGSALTAMGLLPLLEAFSRMTTDQTLLELGDMNRPLLRRLALEAPGTYAHSVSVANLAEAAARVAHANPLLARVGTYYHDIGKIAKPEYFVENQPSGRNPHDRLKPATSAAIVRGHIVEGVRLAEQYKLPDSVKAFIREHHGTQPIGFFREQALGVNPDAEVSASDYAYPGPRPRSKETAILMLADAVESAARVLQDATPERIRSLVDRLVDAKIAQHQLDEAPLTLGEIARIKEELARVVSGMYHHRIDYPHLREPQPEKAAVNGTVAAGSTAGEVPSDRVAAAAADGPGSGLAGVRNGAPAPAPVPAPATSGEGGG